MTEGDIYNCNFCKRHYKEVICLIELNKEIHICNECVDVCITMIIKYRKDMRDFKLIEGQQN